MTPDQPTDRTLAAPEPSVSTGALLAAVVAQGITPASVEVMERLCALREREESRQAEREFATDMIALQQAMPAITANATVPNDDGSPRYKFAQIDHIDGILRPVALKHGFTYSFSETGNDPSRVTKICTVMHKGGHSKSVNFTVRVGKGPPKSSEAQGDGAAATYAQRRALCDAFGIVVDKDSDGADARVVGASVAPAMAAELRARVHACGMDEGKVLKWMQADSFEAIGEADIPRLEAEITKRERKNQETKKPAATDLADKDLFQ